MALTTPAQKPRGLSKNIFLSAPRFGAKGLRGITMDSADYNRTFTRFALENPCTTRICIVSHCAYMAHCCHGGMDRINNRRRFETRSEEHTSELQSLRHLVC